MSTIPLRRARQVLFFLAVVVVLAPPTPGVAQVATGSIVGTVIDSSGQVVPGAPVAVRDINRNTTTNLTTDEARARLRSVRDMQRAG